MTARLPGRALALGLALGACTAPAPPPPSVAISGDSAAGRVALQRYDCGVCHRIPGVRGATGRVGPPLVAFGKRIYIAGRFPNTESMLARWIIDPPALEPTTAMPPLGVSDAEARDMAAYLLSLR